MITSLTFDQLPTAVAELAKDLKEIKALLNQPEPKPTESTNELLTVQETAELLNLAVPTIYGKVHRQELPYMKKGKRLYFSRIEILDWIKSGKQETLEEIQANASDVLLNKKRAEK